MKQALGRIPATVFVFAAFVASAATAQALGPSAPASLAAVSLPAAAAAAAALAVALAVRPALPWICVAAALLGLARVAAEPSDPAAPSRALALAGSQAVVEGVVDGPPRPAGSGVEMMLRPVAVAVDGRLRPADFGELSVLSRVESSAADGDTVRASGKLRVPAAQTGFDARAWLASRGAWLEVSPAQVEVVAPGGMLAGTAGRLRSAYAAALDAVLPPPYSNLALGVVLGVRTGIPPRLRADLVDTGLVHLLVLSGLKVAVVSRLALAALTPLLGRAAALPALLLVGVYAACGGATPAAVRAAAMGGIAVLGGWLGRPSHVWNSLAATAAFMLAVDPRLSMDPGFDLSFAGTAAIVLLTPPVESWLERAPMLRRAPHAFREAFAVTCAAQVGTLPLTAADFHVVPLVAPLANALVLPLLPVTIALGLAAAAAAPVPVAAGVLATPLAGLLAFLAQVAAVLGGAPAWRPAGGFPAWAGVAYYGSGIAALAARALNGRSRLVAAAAAIAFPALVAGGEAVAWTFPGASVTVLATGDGLAALLTGPGGQRALFGGGSSPAALPPALGAALPPWTRRVDDVVVPGPGAAVAGGLAGFDRDAARVVVPAGPMEGIAWRSAVLRLSGGGAVVQPVEAGHALTLAGLRAQVLLPRSGSPAPPRLALRVTGPSGTHVCLLADLAAGAQDDLVPALAAGPPCEHLVLPPPWRTPPTPALVAAARAADVVIATGTPPAAASLRGIRPGAIRRTDQDGPISIRL